MGPYLRTASIKYAEHVGVYLHVGGKRGDMNI